MNTRYGAGDRTRTGTLSPAVDFESTTSTYSITPAGAECIINHSLQNSKHFFTILFDRGRGLHFPKNRDKILLNMGSTHGSIDMQGGLS